MYFNYSNRAPARFVARCGECACGPAEVQQTEKNLPYKENNSLRDYLFNKEIAKGKFSNVFVARNIHSDLIYAVKIYSKVDQKVKRNVDYIKTEKEILLLLKKFCKKTAPFFVQLFETFQDPFRLYLVTKWCPNGSLRQHLKEMKRFDSDLAKFYAAEILYALEYLHSLGIIHMALKAENILLDEKMHIKITSFGSAKILGNWENSKVNKDVRVWQKELSGIFYYVPIELLVVEKLEISRTSDLWAFGSIIYEMISGVRPFQCKSEGVIFNGRFNLFFYFPVKFRACVKDLVLNLLAPDPSQRLGAKDYCIYTSVRSHPFFADIDFEMLYCQTPPGMNEELPGSSVQGRISNKSNITQDLQSSNTYGKIVLGHSAIKRTPSPEPPLEESELGLSSLTPSAKIKKLICQRQNLPRWDLLCHGHLILKKGVLDKCKRLSIGKIYFRKKIIILITLGPHLYLADPTTETIIKEISWGPELQVQHKSLKEFMIYTLRKTYHFIDKKNNAVHWCTAIEELHHYTFKNHDFKIVK